MAMDLASRLPRVVSELEPGGQLLSVDPLTGGVSAIVLGLDIATSTGRRRRVVFRQHRSTEFKQHARAVTAKEFGVLAALHRRGLAVPEPYRYDDTDRATEPYLIIEWIDGSTELARDHLPAGLDQMARFLVDLHSIDEASLHLPELEAIEDPRAALVEYLPSTAAGRHVAAALAAGLAPRDHDRCVLLHGDYWPGNVIWQDGHLEAVIDWEDACLGDPLADLATARVELLCRYGDEAVRRFTTCYLAAHHDIIGPLPLDALTIWELYVSAAALATMGDWGLEPDDEARRRRRTERFFERAARRLG
jgi:aminoglycoside phosphotransferase (APT) family kinase protein